MTFPGLSVWQAFAIGLPVAVVGLAIQELILRRRARRSRPTPAPIAEDNPAPPAPTPAAEPAAPVTAAPATPPAMPPAPPQAPPEAAVATQPEAEDPASPWLPGLLELEADLDQAIEAIVDFVNAPPRLAGAQACAEELERLVPEDRRGTAYSAFVSSLSDDAEPSQLQDLAEAVGVDLTAQLMAVREEINPAG
jgi:hypothetical protein